MKPATFIDFVRGLGVKLTPAQRALCTVAFDAVDPIDLPPDQRTLARQLFGHVDRVPDIAREVLAALCGARGGKSYVLGALRTLHLSLTVDLSTLAPGEHAAAVIVAPDLRLARQTLRYVSGAAKKSQAIARCVVAETKDSITIKRPQDAKTVEIVCLPATAGGSALRGKSLVCCVLDECCFFRDADYAVNDSELYKAAAPRIVPGGMVLLLSTPWTEGGLLYDMHSENFGAPVTCLAAHAPTLLLRDDERTRSIVQRERDRDADNAKREFDAVPMSADASSLLNPEAVKRSTRKFPERLPCDRDCHYVAACDPSEGSISGNAFTLVVVEVRRQPWQQPKFTPAQRDWRPPESELDPLTSFRVAFVAEYRGMSPLQCWREIARECRRYGLRNVWSDSWSAAASRDLARLSGLGISVDRATQESNWQRWADIGALLEVGRLELPPSTQLRDDLLSVQRKPAAMGQWKAVLPRTKNGRHADLAAALALAIQHGRTRPAVGSFHVPGL